MDVRFLYGAPTLTLSEVVDELMIQQQNDKRSHYFTYLSYAKWTWKKLLKDTVWTITQQVVDVSEDNQIVLPSDLSQLIGLSIVDHHGLRQPIIYNPLHNTVKVKCAPKKQCSCGCNGAGTLCDIMDMIVFRTEPVDMNGTTYEKKIWNRKDELGNLTEVTESPAYDPITDTVQYVKSVQVLCALEVDDNCCILPTEKNRQLLYSHCGCHIVDNKFLENYAGRGVGRDNKAPYANGYGGWNWSATANDTIEVFYSRAKQVIVSYRVSEDAGGQQLLVPEFALEALWMGIIARQAAFSQVVSVSEAEVKRKNFEREKTRLLKDMNKVSLSEFAQLGSKYAVW